MLTIRDQLLNYLLTHQDQYVSGEEMSRQLGVSRAAVWKQIGELRKAGYQIEAKTRNGYRLLYRPDRVASEEIYPHLRTERLGRSIHYQPSVSSTQTIAHQWAKEGAPEGALVIADEQVQGKGRLGRVWHSPPRTGIWMSLILRPPVPLRQASHFPLLASIGVSQGIEQISSIPVQCKWPNDILMSGKKIAGILTEMRAEQDRIHYLVIGIGLNVNQTQFPSEIDDVATSLAQEAGHSFHRPQLIAWILDSMETIYQEYLTNGFTPLIPLWEEKASMLGELVQVQTPQGRISGMAEGIEKDGSLRIRNEQGIHSIYSADWIITEEDVKKGGNNRADNN